MVLAWVPAHSQQPEQEDGKEGPLSDLSSSADEGGPHFQHCLVLNSPSTGIRASKSRRSTRSKKPPSANGHPEGGVVLTGYRSTAEPLPLRCPPLMPKPPRRSKGGSLASLDGDLQPPAIPPKAPMKPPRSSLGPLTFSRRSSLQYPLELNRIQGDISTISAGEGHLMPPPTQPPPPPPISQTPPPILSVSQQLFPTLPFAIPPPPSEPPPLLLQGLPPPPTQPLPPLENPTSEGPCQGTSFILGGREILRRGRELLGR